MVKNLVEPTIAIAEEAGAIALRYFHDDAKGVEWKSDKTPVTLADQEMNQYIHDALMAIDSSIPIISEEMANSSYQQRKHWQSMWIVDPLDGTKHFIDKRKDYSVNIALVKNDSPVFSVVLAPSLDLCYYAIRGQGAFRRSEGGDIRLQCQEQQKSETTKVLISHGQPGWKLKSYLQGIENYEFIRLGSSLKQCWIAEGLADIYPRFGKTSEWDTAAAQLILEEAGGAIVNQKGNKLIYNKEQLENPEFIASAPWYRATSPWYTKD